MILGPLSAIDLLMKVLDKIRTRDKHTSQTGHLQVICQCSCKKTKHRLQCLRDQTMYARLTVATANKKQ